MTPEQRALARHRQRGRAIGTLCKAIDQINSLPPVFTTHEREVILERFASLMLVWLSGNGFQVTYEQ